MRLGIASCLALAAIPMMATGLFFDGGATLAAGTANAAVLGGLLAGKLAGLAGAGLLLGGRGRSNRGHHYTTSYHRPSYSRSYRHKREVLKALIFLEELHNSLFFYKHLKFLVFRPTHCFLMVASL